MQNIMSKWLKKCLNGCNLKESNPYSNSNSNSKLLQYCNYIIIVMQIKLM